MHSFLHNFDVRVAAWIAQLPQGWYPAISAFTWLGSPSVIIALAVVGAIYTYTNHQLRIALGLLAILPAIGMNTVLKYIFQRDRPDTLYVEDMLVRSFSFPSGHAFGSTVLYGLLAYLAYTRLPQPYDVLVLLVLVLLIITIGLSRVYLGAHFPSDVIAGWLFGGIVVLAIIKVLHI